MARALSKVVAFSDSIAFLIARRGVASSAAAAGGRVEEKAVMMGAKREEAVDQSASSSWVPDPVTGYYRPANRDVEVDAADLRVMHLSNRSRD